MKKLIFEEKKKRRYAYKEEIKIRNNSYGISNMKINSTLILKTLENYKKLGITYSAAGIREKDLRIEMDHEVVREYLMFRNKLLEYVFILVDDKAELQCLLNRENIKEKTLLFFELMKNSMFDGYFETIENEKKIVKKIIDNDDFEILLQFSRGVNSLFVPVIYKENMEYSNIFYINDLIPGGSIPVKLDIKSERCKKQITGKIHDVYFDRIQFEKIIKNTFFYNKMKDCGLDYQYDVEIDENDGFLRNGNLFMRIVIDSEIEIEKRISVILKNEG